MNDHRFYFKEWRKKRGLTQDRVIERLEAMDDPHLPQTTASLSRIENGKQPYSQRILEALADIYTVEPFELLRNNPEKEGDLVDLVRVMDERKRAQAMAVLEALAAS